VPTWRSQKRLWNRRFCMFACEQRFGNENAGKRARRAVKNPASAKPVCG